MAISTAMNRAASSILCFECLALRRGRRSDAVRHHQAIACSRCACSPDGPPARECAMPLHRRRVGPGRWRWPIASGDARHISARRIGDTGADGLMLAAALLSLAPSGDFGDFAAIRHLAARRVQAELFKRACRRDEALLQTSFTLRSSPPSGERYCDENRLERPCDSFAARAASPGIAPLLSQRKVARTICWRLFDQLAYTARAVARASALTVVYWRLDARVGHADDDRADCAIFFCEA